MLHTPSRSLKIAELYQVPFLHQARIIIGEAVHSDHLVALGDQPYIQVGADEARCAGD
jgi:hypothetical protein